eukprot:9038671-Pyramimonas_sp.AAC.1
METGPVADPRPLDPCLRSPDQEQTTPSTCTRRRRGADACGARPHGLSTRSHPTIIGGCEGPGDGT